MLRRVSMPRHLRGMRTALTVVLVSTMATACVGEPDLSTRTQGVLEGNAIASNAIASNTIHLNAIASNAIASNAISDNLLQLTSTELLATPDGRELLTYIVSCALPREVTLTGSYAGVSYQFIGDIGLASSWTARSLRETEQRWVSACLIARVNLYGIPVSISIRGAHKALKVSEAEARDYSVEEGAFYGNVFRAVDEPIVWNACRGRGQAVSESGTLDLRDCTEEDPTNPGFTRCGFAYAGDCGDWAPPANAYACKRFRNPSSRHAITDTDVLSTRDYHGGFYEECHDSPGFGTWHHAERFAEVLTVFVMP
jgi:hypothetical protein